MPTRCITDSPILCQNLSYFKSIPTLPGICLLVLKIYLIFSKIMTVALSSPNIFMFSVMGIFILQRTSL